MRKTKHNGMFHLSPIENQESIEANGIRAEDGCIFLFTHPMVANPIARDQVGADRYAVWSIDPAGITGTLDRDYVAEFTASFHRVLEQQACIAPQHLKLIGVFDTTPGPDEFDFWFYRRIQGWSRRQTRQHFAEMDEILKTLRTNGAKRVCDAQREVEPQLERRTEK